MSNTFLNVGPDRTGRIPQESIDRLTEVGKWMERNGEGIYGTQAGPFNCRLPWGRVTAKPDGENTILYLHVLDWPADGKLLLPGLANELISAGMLGAGMDPAVTSSPHGPVLNLPKIKRSGTEISTTLKVLIKGCPQVRRVPVLADGDRVIRLTPMDARLNGKLELGQSGGMDRIGFEDVRSQASWDVEAPEDGEYRVMIHAATQEAGPMLQVLGVGEFTVKVAASKAWRKHYQAADLGTVTLKKGQRLEVVIKPVTEGWKPVNVHQLALVPVER